MPKRASVYAFAKATEFWSARAHQEKPLKLDSRC